MFPGRTEYLEKYGRAVGDFNRAGYAVIAVDWRGQGYSDRLIGDTRLGHIRDFADYQIDVEVFVESAEVIEAPKPWFLLAHSMGGCIGLRALLNGLPVERAVFSAPMWGIYAANNLRPLAKYLPAFARATGQGLRVLPGTLPTSYVLDTPLDENLLTTDPDHFAYLQRHANAAPELALGGPTFDWFYAAREEMKALRFAARPSLPALTCVGSLEEVVDPEWIARVHQHWPSAELVTIPGGKHEMMMEVPEVRTEFMSRAIEFFDAGLAMK